MKVSELLELLKAYNEKNEFAVITIADNGQGFLENNVDFDPVFNFDTLDQLVNYLKENV